MTAMPHGLTPDQRVAAIPPEQINSVLIEDENPEARFDMRQSRDGEDAQGVAISAQIHALYLSDWFWEFCAQVFPNNDVLPEHRTGGAPAHFPDWFLFLMMCSASMAGHATIKSAVTYFANKTNWADFVGRVDRYVPEGMTRLRDLPFRPPRNGEPRLLATAGTKKADGLKARQPDPSLPTPLRFTPTCAPPQGHHLDQFILRWRGTEKKTGAPFPIGHRDYGIRDKAFEAFRALAIDQAQLMGVLHPGLKFFYRNPSRHQMIGVDGVVLRVPRKGENPTAADYRTGTGHAYGTKFTIFSTRIFGQYMSRLILDLTHTHKDYPGSATDESKAVLAAMPALQKLAGGGLRGVLVDSAVRGNAVTQLQRRGIIVVNYPHAEHNPDGGPGRRLNPSRKEKSKLRLVADHIDQTGHRCEHYIYAVGGELLELVATADGTDALRPLPVKNYETVSTKKGTVREYLLVEVPCWAGGFTARVPLFHTDPTSNAPGDVNWGEVCRVYPPGSAEFKYLYGGRNDTEARHNDLKARIKNLPRDVRGQELRLLGAAMAINAIAWQVHLHAHKTHPNVIDDTA